MPVIYSGLVATQRDYASKIIEAVPDAQKKTVSGELDQLLVVNQKQLLQRKEVRYRRIFSSLVITIYVSTNLLIGVIIWKAFLQDLELVRDLDGYKRLIDGNVVIALISGVVVQTAVSFGILTKYVYGATAAPDDPNVVK